MHGPAFDGSGKIVEREVVMNDVPDYMRAGYEKGGLPESEKIKQDVAELKEESKVTKAF